MKYNKRWTTLIYLIISISIAWFIINSFYDYYKNTVTNNNQIELLQEEFNIINSWLTALQKIIFEKALFFSFNQWLFSFKVLENNVEVEYNVDLIECWNWFKKLVYSDWISNIDLFSNKCLPIKNIEISFLNNELKEQVFRLKISTENSDYFTTLFVIDVPR